MLCPRQPHHGLAILGGRCRRGVRQNRHAGRGRRHRPIVQHAARPVIRIDGNIIVRTRAQAGNRGAAGLARTRHHHVVARADLGAAAISQTGRVLRPIARVRTNRPAGPDENNRPVGGTRIVPDNGRARTARRQERGNGGAGGRLRLARRGIRARNRGGCAVIICAMCRCAVIGKRED